jgi:hypothetical protein
MKGMWNVLERAGLVRQEGSESVPAQPGEPVAAPPSEPAPTPTSDTSIHFDDMVLTTHSKPSLSLDQVYQTAAIPVAPYPAERLMRLIEGLRAMDEGTRRQAIQAMDAADDTWSMDDPIRDASAKAAAIDSYVQTLRSELAQSEQATRGEMEEKQRQHKASVAEIMRQMSDLEGLLSREIARGTQETAALESELQARIASTDREMRDMARSASELKSLVAQFKPNTTT